MFYEFKGNKRRHQNYVFFASFKKKLKIAQRKGTYKGGDREGAK
jgi:hypothetical protein